MEDTRDKPRYCRLHLRREPDIEKQVQRRMMVSQGLRKYSTRRRASAARVTPSRGRWNDSTFAYSATIDIIPTISDERSQVVQIRHLHDRVRVVRREFDAQIQMFQIRAVFSEWK